MISSTSNIGNTPSAQAARVTQENKKLRSISPEELASMSSRCDPNFVPEDLDEACHYCFNLGDQVWIRTAGGEWRRGQVVRQAPRKGPTREGEGLFYHVQFDNVRKYFAPLNGEIKPDNEEIRNLLEIAGLL